MQPAAERMAERLRQVQIRSPEIPVLHNVHVQAETEPDAIRDVLVRQLASPVRWVETIEKMVHEYPLDLIGIIPEDDQVHDFDLSGRPTIELDEGSKALKVAFDIFVKIINPIIVNQEI